MESLCELTFENVSDRDVFRGHVKRVTLLSAAKRAYEKLTYGQRAEFARHPIFFDGQQKLENLSYAELECVLIIIWEMIFCPTTRPTVPFNKPEDLIAYCFITEDAQDKIKTLGPESLQEISCRGGQYSNKTSKWEDYKSYLCSLKFQTAYEALAFETFIEFAFLRQTIRIKFKELSKDDQSRFRQVIDKKFPFALKYSHFSCEWLEDFTYLHELGTVLDILESFNSDLMISNDILRKFCALRHDHQVDIYTKVLKTHDLKSVVSYLFKTKEDLNAFTAIVNNMALREQVEKVWKTIPDVPRKGKLEEQIMMRFPLKALNSPYNHEWYYLPSLTDDMLQGMLDIIAKFSTRTYEERLVAFSQKLYSVPLWRLAMISDILECFNPSNGRIQEIISTLYIYEGDKDQIMTQLEHFIAGETTGRESIDFVVSFPAKKGKDIEKKHKRVLLGLIGSEHSIKHFYGVFCGAWESANKCKKDMVKAYAEQIRIEEKKEKKKNKKASK